MKDNISIIFTAIIGTFLIVLLPLYSILDRQDSMSYNVVLTSTTNFVDSIRNNGFVDRQSYYDYISALASTANTYKVTIEAYRKTLIKETDEFGNVITDSFVEEIELYNTQDILSVLEGETDINTDKSNEKNNVYLFDVNDEIYVKVHNTNMTAGSVIYNVVAGVTNKEVINVSYGGVVNKINWELYDKIQADVDLAPEVVMSVPVNAQNSTNIVKIRQDGELEEIDCSLENLDEVVGETNIEELCGDEIDSASLGSYTYYYDLSKEQNRTIKVAVELRRVDKIYDGSTYIPITELNESDFNTDGVKSQRELNIIHDYIQLNGMYANIDLQLRTNKEYYVFDIILTNVTMSALDYISSFASVTILPGLGMDENGVLSLGAETVQIELRDENATNTVVISRPHNWKQYIKTKDIDRSTISDDTIYSNQEIFFVITYTGIRNVSQNTIKNAIRENLKIYINEAEYSDIEIYTVEELNKKYGTNEETGLAGRMFVKFKYTQPNNSKNNYIELLEGWIATNMDMVDIYTEYGEPFVTYAPGAKSSEYAVLLDDVGPLEPGILLGGTKGENNWFTTDVTLNLIGSTSDQVRKTEEIKNEDGTVIGQSTILPGGSGIYKDTITVEGANVNEEQETKQIVLDKEGTSYAIGKSYDYIGNYAQTERVEIKIDKTPPTEPIISVSGTRGENGWYKSEVVVQITPGTDNISGVAETKYRIEGANELVEQEGTTYTVFKEGKSTFIATTWDNAGNKSETSVNINIDTSTPPDAKIEVVEGQKNSPSTDWYYTDVKLRITVDTPESVSGLGTSSYSINGSQDTEFVGNTQEITFTENGEYEIVVTNATGAGNTKETKYTVKIDKSAPNTPTLDFIGTEGENGWYTSDVEVSVLPNGDVGSSGQKTLTYKIIKNGNEPDVETEIANSNKILLQDEGELKLIVYSRDNAFNKVESEHVIRIDKTPPNSAEFVINGTPGKDDWYTSDVYLDYQGATDEISGIQNVVLSQESIKENTLGTTVTLTTKDNAGNVVTNEKIIKIDKYAPVEPEISILDDDIDVNVNGPFGVIYSNHPVEIKIVPGRENLDLENNNNIDKTTYEVTTDEGLIEFVSETVINKEVTFKTGEWTGDIQIKATTWDKAGNSSTVTMNLKIRIYPPSTPVITSINGEDVEDVQIKTINSTSPTINLEIDNLDIGNKVTIILITSTYDEIVIERIIETDGPIIINLTEKGSYNIEVMQTNIYGTESGISPGKYTYIYE